MNVEMWVRALKAARAGAEVSQEALATLTKWSPSTVAAIETGRRRPTMEFAVAADEALATGGLLAELLEAADRSDGRSWFVPWRGYEQQAIRACVPSRRASCRASCRPRTMPAPSSRLVG